MFCAILLLVRPLATSLPFIATGALLVCACADFRTGPLDGALSDGPDSAPPLKLNAYRLSAGEAFTCALCSRSGITLPCCWGSNEKGQLGTGLGKNSVGDEAGEMRNLKPASVGSLGSAKVLGVAVGGVHACAWTDSGVRCWGYNQYGQLGYGDTTSRSEPAQLGSALQTVDIGTGFLASAVVLGYDHTCAVSAASVRCWGSNEKGELGIGSSVAAIGDASGEMGKDLVDTSIGGTAATVSTGKNVTCIVTNDGKVACYGAASLVGLGGAADVGRNVSQVGALAVTLDLGGKVKSVAAGEAHVCALLEDGNVKCWGENSSGELGYEGPAVLSANATIASVSLGSKALAIATGGSTTCAIVDGGLVKCWGDNRYGQLGIGTKTPQSAATAVAQRAPFLVREQRTVELSVGGGHVCAYVEGDVIYCWGRNDKGQLGIDNANDIGDEASEMAALVSVNLLDK